MGRTTPLVSVILPAFDVADSIGAAIDSLRAQTLADFEALVIDDGSADDTAARAQAAIAGDARFRVIRQANGGLSRARNAGLEAARGDLIAFLDGDDTLAPDFLQVMTDALQDAGADWAACAIELVHPDHTAPHAALHGIAPESGLLDLRDARLAARVFPSAWNKLYRRALFDGVRFTPGTWFEDHEVFWALAARQPRLAYIDRPLVRYRQGRPGQITGADDERVMDQFGVLARLAPLVRGGAFDHGDAGFDRLATRLVGERLRAVRTPERRARFLAAAHASMAGLGWRCDTAGDADIDPALPALLMPPDAPPLAVDVLVLPCPLSAARVASVTAQEAQGVSLTLWQDPAALPPRQAGRWLLVLGPGETLEPGALRVLAAVAHWTGADACHGAHWRSDGVLDDGWTDNRAAGLPPARWGAEGACLPMPPAGLPGLRLAPVRAARLLRASALSAEQWQALTGADPLAAQVALWGLAQGGGATHAQTRLPVARLLADPPPPAPSALIAALGRLAPPDPGVTGQGWRGVLALRALRVARVRAPLRWLSALARLWARGWLPGPPPMGADPETPRWVRGLLRALT